MRCGLVAKAKAAGFGCDGCDGCELVAAASLAVGLSCFGFSGSLASSMCTKDAL